MKKINTDIFLKLVALHPWYSFQTEFGLLVTVNDTDYLVKGWKVFIWD